MNKFLTLAITALSSLPMFAALNTMNYQAVINKADGKPAAESPIGLRFAIVAQEATLFTEEAVVTSTDQGLVEWQIGSTSENGLAGIDWSADGIALQVSIDLNGGTDYTTVYTSTIQAVPTAMYAAKAGDSDELRDEIYGNRERIDYLMYELDKNLSEINDRLQNTETTAAQNFAELATAIEDTRIRLDNLNADTQNLTAILNAEVNQLRMDNDEQAMYINMLRDESQMHMDRINMLEADVTNLKSLIDYLQTQIEELRNK